MFSTTTIASSMTSPTPMARPPRVIRLSPWPSKRITPNVMTMVRGITTPAIRVMRQLRRKNSRTRVESTSPIKIASRRLSIAEETRID